MINCGSDKCNCECHSFPGLVEHCMPCCCVCPHCGKNVVFFEMHIRECEAAKLERDIIAELGVPSGFLKDSYWRTYYEVKFDEP